MFSMVDEEKKTFFIKINFFRHQGLYSQHSIFFVTYKWAK